jgi:hypothetical protein
VEGATDDEYFMEFRGDVAGDPIDVWNLVNGAVSWSARTPINLINPNVNMISIRSDGALNRTNFNGNDIVLTDTNGVNAGQWLNDAPDGNVFSLAVERRAALTRPFNGRQQGMLIYDRELSQLEHQQIWARGFTPRGPRWYPDR